MAKLTVCVSVMLVLLAALGDSSPMNTCCTQYHESPIPVRLLKYHTIQEDVGYCNIKAIIFKTVKNKLVCADPDRKWVQRAMELVPLKSEAEGNLKKST